MPNAVTTHVKEHKMPYTLSLLIPLAPLALAVVTQNSHTDEALRTHHLEQEHPATERKLIKLGNDVNLMLELQLAKEIHAILQDRCVRNDDSFSENLERLQKAYKDITGSRYVLRCERRS